MWTEVYFSQNEEKVKKFVEMLNEAQIISRVKCIKGADEVRSKCFKVLVPATELSEAQSIMVDNDLF